MKHVYVCSCSGTPHVYFRLTEDNFPVIGATENGDKLVPVVITSIRAAQFLLEKDPYGLSKDGENGLRIQEVREAGLPEETENDLDMMLDSFLKLRAALEFTALTPL